MAQTRTAAVPAKTPDQAVRDKARALGFDAVGIARANEPLEVDHERYEAFVDAGMHGDMDWLAENREVRRRLDTSGILEGAKSIVCLAVRYARPEDEIEAPPSSLAPRIARYARGQDYHNRVKKRVQRLAAFVRTLGPDVRARPMTDTAPLLERAWAARAGLGFVGKNGMIIIPGQGSYALLGEVVTNLELLPDVPITERCGSCTRCLDACPTDAFVRPFVLDATKCISYLTIEHRGAMPEPLRASVGEHLFGCDVCQEVCPFNRTRVAPEPKTRPFAPLDRWRERTVDDLLALDEAEWAAISSGTPLRRATLEGLLRNAITVAANERNPARIPALERLLHAHDDPGVREHAAWALRSLRENAATAVERG
jgi:epoxyqueuosine reductase